MEAKDRMELFLHPEKYGYEECKNCNGYGSSLREDTLKCVKCSGSGLVKKDKE